MKKARIMLMAIAVMGVVGGALAFKATKSFGGTARICTTPTFTVGGVTVSTCPAGYIINPAGTITTTVYTSTSSATHCAYTTVNAVGSTTTVFCTTSIPNTVVSPSGGE